MGEEQSVCETSRDGDRKFGMKLGEQRRLTHQDAEIRLISRAKAQETVDEGWLPRQDFLFNAHMRSFLSETEAELTR